MASAVLTRWARSCVSTTTRRLSSKPRLAVPSAPRPTAVAVLQAGNAVQKKDG